MLWSYFGIPSANFRAFENGVPSPCRVTGR